MYTLIGGLGPALAAFLAHFKETSGKIFFLSFFTFVTYIFNGIRRSFAAGSPGAVYSDPFGILRQVLLHHPGVSDEWGRKKLAKSEQVAKKAVSAGPSPPISATHTEDQC